MNERAKTFSATSFQFSGACALPLGEGDVSCCMLVATSTDTDLRLDIEYVSGVNGPKEWIPNFGPPALKHGVNDRSADRLGLTRLNSRYLGLQNRNFRSQNREFRSEKYIVARTKSRDGVDRLTKVHGSYGELMGVKRLKRVGSRDGSFNGVKKEFSLTDLNGRRRTRHERFRWTSPFIKHLGGINMLDFHSFKFGDLAYFGGVTLREQITEVAKQAKAASRELAKLSTAEKNASLLAMAEALEKNAASIKEANAKDMAAGSENGLSPAMLDRLKLDDKRIAGMAKGLREVAALPDPVGRVLDTRTRPNGLKLEKISTPIGVVVIIYESRPNVTADAASLCFKSGNATILRGGKEAIYSNQAIAKVMIAAAKQQLPNFPEHAIQVVQTTDREAIKELLSLTQYVDLCMPRGGEGLIRAVAECSKVPVIKHYKGVCHVYVDAEADTKMAEEIVLNGKVQRPGVCNAIETLLVDKAVAQAFLPAMAMKLAEKKVELRVDGASQNILNGQQVTMKPATEEDWFAEYLDLILAVRVVDGVQEAIQHINHYGSAHSDSIVTRNEKRANQFLAEVDSATVYWNASTRFTDGGEFGMGAEIGISTDKIGARGPMGLEELTTYKWIGIGTGQVRS